MRLDRRGKKLFDKVTRENVGKTWLSCSTTPFSRHPRLRCPFLMAWQSLRGISAPRKPETLPLCLREGALPAPVTVVENRAVGPSLGSDSITQGIRQLCSAVSWSWCLCWCTTAFRLNCYLALALNFVIIMGVLALPGSWSDINSSWYCRHHSHPGDGGRRQCAHL